MSIAPVSSRILDPVFDRAGLRAEFRFPAQSLFQSDLRLINIGVIADTNGDQPNPLLGVMAAIKSITLMDGSTQLDALNFATLWSSFRNAHKSNDDNVSLQRFLKYVQTGYTTQGLFEVADDQIRLQEPKIIEQSQQTYAAKQLDAQRAWISLKDLLPFLRSSLYLPTNVFRQLRLVIEYNSAAELTNLTLDATSVKTTSSDSLLLCEEVGDSDFKMAVMRQYKGVVFSPIEHEQVYVGEVQGLDDAAGQRTVTQNANFLLSGFNNKKLRRVAVVQQPTDAGIVVNNVVIGYGEMASVAAYQATYQFRVNGMNVLAGSGMAGSATGSYANRRLAYLHDAWGVSNIFMGQNVSSLPRLNNLQHAERVGQQDYVGLKIDAQIAELQMSFSRVGVANPAASATFKNNILNQALNLHIFGEVDKAVIMNKDGSYNVVYL